MKRVLKIYLMVCVVLSIQIVAQGQSMPPELHEYLKMAASGNPGLKAKYTRFEMAVEKVAQSNGLPDPTLSFGYFVQPIETRVGPQQAKLSLTQMFPWFGTLKANSQRDSLMAQSRYQEFLEARYQLYYEVKSAYYPIYELHQTIRLHEENIKILENFKQISTVKYKNGIGSMVDVIRVDILLENAQTEIEVLRSQKYPLEVRFNRLLNREDSMVVYIPRELKISKDEIIGDSILGNPVLRAYDLQIESSKAEQIVAKKQGHPMIGVGVDYVFVGNSESVVQNSGRDAWMPMVSMTLPIYRKKYKSAVRTAELKEKALQLEQHDYENTLMTDYELARYTLEISVEKLDSYQRQIKNSEMAIKILMASYSNSGKDFEEVLRMQQELLQYQKAQVVAMKEYHIALARLKYLTGDPFP
ncbi:TolC family protein [bacterium SCSIO 12643]|nr:TolC family protein [bacterium SCSIO 12643]